MPFQFFQEFDAKLALLARIFDIEQMATYFFYDRHCSKDTSSRVISHIPGITTYKKEKVLLKEEAQSCYVLELLEKREFDLLYLSLRYRISPSWPIHIDNEGARVI